MIVVDSSVALQLLLPEPGAAEAELLIGRTDLAAPDVIFVEVANVLSKKVRAGDMTLAQAHEGLRVVAAAITRVEPTTALLPRALELSVVHPVYDCTFLACALLIDGVVASRDQPLIDRAAEHGYGPRVQAYPFAAVAP